MTEHLIEVGILFAATTLILWLGLVIALWVIKPDRESLKEGFAIMPDLYKLVRKILADKTIKSRWKLWLLLAYLAFPIDLVPDLIPVIGWADDVVIALWALRSTLQDLQPQKLDSLWPGSPEGLAALRRLLRLAPS